MIWAHLNADTQAVIIEDYEQAIIEYAAHAHEIIQGLIEAKERFKQVGINKRVAAELVGRLFIEENIVTPTQVNIIKREIDHPTFDYHALDSLWELYNHCTFAMKETHPSNIINNHILLHKFFNDYAFRF